MGLGINAGLLLDSAREPKANQEQPSAHGVRSMGEIRPSDYRQTACPERPSGIGSPTEIGQKS